MIQALVDRLAVYCKPATCTALLLASALPLSVFGTTDSSNSSALAATEECAPASNKLEISLPVQFVSSLNGGSAFPGQTVRTKIDGTLSLGSKIIVQRGSHLIGHVELSRCTFKKESLMRIKFDHIETPSGGRLPVEGSLLPQLGTYSYNGVMKHAHIDDDGCLIDLMPLFMTEKEKCERYEALCNIVDKAAASFISSNIIGGGLPGSGFPGAPPRAVPGSVPLGLLGGPGNRLKLPGGLPMGGTAAAFPGAGNFSLPKGPPSGALNYRFLMQWFPTIISAGRELIPLYLDKPGTTLPTHPAAGESALPWRSVGSAGLGRGPGLAGGVTGSELFQAGRIPMLGRRTPGLGLQMMQASKMAQLMPVLPIIMPLAAPVVAPVVASIVPRLPGLPSRESQHAASGMSLEVPSEKAFFHGHPLPTFFPLPPEPLNEMTPMPLPPVPASQRVLERKTQGLKPQRTRRRFDIEMGDELKVKIVLLSEDPLPPQVLASQPDGAVEIEVELNDQISSHYCYVGQSVTARLLKDAVIGDHKVGAGAVVQGSITRFRRARRLGSSIADRKSNSRNGLVSVQFHKINAADQKLEIVGFCPPQSNLFNNSGKFKVVRVNSVGEIEGIQDLSIQTPDPLGTTLLSVAKGGLQQSLGTVGSFGALPLIMGTASVIEPRLVATKPIEEDRTSAGRRFVLGASGAVPGGNLVAAFMLKGDELELQEGDRLKLLVRPLTITSVSSKIRDKTLEKEDTQ